MTCAKYGWTLHYVLWEVSYLNLYMLLTDTLSTIDTKDKETQGASSSKGGVKSNTGGFMGFMNTMKSLKN